MASPTSHPHTYKKWHGYAAIAAVICLLVTGIAIGNNGKTSVNPNATATTVTSTGSFALSDASNPADPAAQAPTLSGSGTLPPVKSTFTQGAWTIDEIDLASDPIVKARLQALCDPAPSEWPVFPNVENSKSTSCPFKVANGAEYGVANVPFCQQDTRCDFVVPARHYRLITADYGFMGTTCQQATKGQGCLLLLINVGGETYTFRNQMADNGFTVPGRYWNGDLLEQAIQGLVSHASANMLNMPTNGLKDEVLNAGGSGDVNAGTNCGVPEACGSVNVTVVIHAGNRVLAVAKTTVAK